MDVLIGLLGQFLFQRRALLRRASKDVIRRAGIRSLTRGEHHLVRLPADQESIDGLHELRADLGDFLAPVNPVESTVLAGDVVVETVSEAKCDFSYLVTSGAFAKRGWGFEEFGAHSSEGLTSCPPGWSGNDLQTLALIVQRNNLIGSQSKLRVSLPFVIREFDFENIGRQYLYDRTHFTAP